MKSFSQRKGFKPVAEVLQIDSMNSELRNSLWNVLDIEIWSADRFDSLDPFCEALWFKFFKKPLDSRPRGNYPILLEIREYFLSASGLKCTTSSNSLSGTTSSPDHV